MNEVTYSGTLKERDHFCSVLYNDAIYIFGGWGLEDVRKYTISTSKWSTLSTTGTD